MIKRYSIEPKHIMFYKGFGLVSFDKNVSENISKNLSGTYFQSLLDSAKKSGSDLLETASKRTIQKIAEATSDLIGNKIAVKIKMVSKTSPKTIKIETASDRDIKKKKYLPPVKRKQIINGLRLI